MAGETPDRGGQNAVAGFLFQILGAQGCATAVYIGPPEDPEPEARIIHEAFGQDTVIQRGGAGGRRKTCELVQYKYSRQAAPPPFGREELTEIANRLAESRGHASTAGYTEIRYRLISNRTLGSTAKELISDMQVRRTSKRRGRPPANEVILAELVYEYLDFTKALADLRHMADRYGALPQEVDSAIKRWIGELAFQTATRGATEVSSRDFVTALVGAPDARPLAAESVKPRAFEAFLHGAKEDLWIPPNSIRRQVVDELAQAVLDHALVLLDGEGGSGKTVSLMHGARTRLELPGGVGALTAVDVAEHVEEDWVQKVVRRWTAVGMDGPAAWHTDNVETSMRRVLIANSDLPHPVLWLGLDGVDEVDPANQERIRRLVYHFAREELRLRRTGVRPLASLVVTCRGRRPFERLLPMPRTEPRPLCDTYHRIAVLGFGRDELLGAGASVPLTILNRLRVGLAEREIEPTGTSEQGPGMLTDASAGLPAPLGGASRSPARPPDPIVLRSLEHPPMWRGFVRLDEADQHAALNGNDAALARLGWHFVEWFFLKATLRSVAWRNLEADLPALLIAVARATAAGGEGPHRRIEDWVHPLRETGLIEATGAQAFLGEAASAGVVEETGPKWAWRHAFLPAALIAGDPAGAGSLEGAR
jgi:hypothetical protein